MTVRAIPNQNSLGAFGCRSCRGLGLVGVEAGEQLAVCGRCGGSGLSRAALRVTRRMLRPDPDRLRVTGAAMCGPGSLGGAGLQRGRSSR